MSLGSTTEEGGGVVEPRFSRWGDGSSSSSWAEWADFPEEGVVEPRFNY